uniref:Patatin n=1 Tax=Oryza glaberrima TaxID=4538 RepID=I1R375_ORYGL
AGRARGEDRGLLRRDRRDEHRGADHVDVGGAGRQPATALRRRRPHQVLPRERAQDLPVTETVITVGFLTPVANLIGAVRGPKYDGSFLHDKIKSLTHDVTIADTVTNIVVPAFDVKYLQPIIFSTYEAKNEPLKNAHLSDICISTSAVPTYFPAHLFKTTSPSGESREFHLIDGGVAANNPTMVAMSMISKEVLRENQDFKLGKPADYRHYLVILIGMGTAKMAEKYTAPACAKWGVLRWLYDSGFTPLIDIFSHASADMVDIHASVLFQSLSCEKSYLRIQKQLIKYNTEEVLAIKLHMHPTIIGLLL